LTAIAELPQQHHRRAIFHGGYPSFPLKEIAVCRTVYRESTHKDLDIAHCEQARRRRCQRLKVRRTDFDASKFSLNPLTTSMIYRKGTKPGTSARYELHRESRYHCDCIALQGFCSVLFSNCRRATGGFQ
jgi:hypothetical protein